MFFLKLFNKIKHIYIDKYIISNHYLLIEFTIIYNSMVLTKIDRNKLYTFYIKLSMKTYIIVLVLIIIIAISMYGIRSKRETFESRNPEADTLLLTTYPKKFVCSKDQDEVPKHVRIGKTGGIMYTSYHPPTEANCRLVDCAIYLKNDLEARDISKYNPTHVFPARTKLSYPEWKRNVYCWLC
jgi:hypothetical protein